MIILGKIPPPIGGVTIHVKRLIEHLDKVKFDFQFVDLNMNNLMFLIFKKHKIIHVHTSSILVQLYVSILSRICLKTLIITFHGDLSRYTIFKTFILKIVLKLVHYPIVLNNGSLEFAKSLNGRTVFISSFLPPILEEKLSPMLRNQIFEFKFFNNKIYATNAYSLTFDKNGIEIYGILDLIEIFNTNLFEKGLIISDPSGNYTKYLKNAGIELNSRRILIIDRPHSFYEIIKLVDGTIRNTSTDGDSISVKESLYLQKETYATNVVSRPYGCVNYKRGDYKFFDENYTFSFQDVNKFELNGFNSLIKLYSRINNNM